METIRHKPTHQLVLLPLFFLGLLIMGLSSWLMSLCFGAFPALGELHLLALFIAVLVFMGVAVVFHWRAKGRTGMYLTAYFLNAAGSGISIGILLGRSGLIPPPAVLLALLPVATLCAAFCLLFAVSGEKRSTLLAFIFSVCALALIGFGIYFWICKEPLTGCAFVFSGLFFLPFPFCIAGSAEDSEEKYHYLSYSGFGAFILIAFVVALILSEGEILDGFDFDFGGGSRKKKRT